jgi:Flp pilus assembly protein TadG
MTKRSDRGTALVEFALAAPVMILLLIGLIEVGRYMYFAVKMANAARAGVDYGAQSLAAAGNTAGIQNAALQDWWDATSTPNPSAITVAVSHSCELANGTATPCPSGSPPQNVVYYLEVDTSGTFTSLLNYPGMPNSVPISGKAIMRVTNR